MPLVQQQLIVSERKFKMNCMAVIFPRYFMQVSLEARNPTLPNCILVADFYPDRGSRELSLPLSSCPCCPNDQGMRELSCTLSGIDCPRGRMMPSSAMCYIWSMMFSDMAGLVLYFSLYKTFHICYVSLSFVIHFLLMKLNVTREVNKYVKR